MNQRGVTFLEVVVVIAVLMITSALVAPSIGDWRQKRTLEADFAAVLAQIDYLKARVRTLNGTALLICNGQTGHSKILTYQVSNNTQTATDTVASPFASNLVEDPLAKNPTFNVLSGQSTVYSPLCAGVRGIFISSGASGLEGGAGHIWLDVVPTVNTSTSQTYRVSVNLTSSFIQKYKCNSDRSVCTEMD